MHHRERIVHVLTGRPLHHHAALLSGRDGLRLAIELGNGAVLEVYSSPGSTEADLVSFGAGITVDLDRI